MRRDECLACLNRQLVVVRRHQVLPPKADEAFFISAPCRVDANKEQHRGGKKH
jgi:hypothetical protein